MNQQDQHPLLDKMNAARRFRLSPEADERILDTLRQAEEASADEGLFGLARLPWAKLRRNWRPAAAACLAVVIVGGAVGVSYANGGFHSVQMYSAQTALTKPAAPQAGSASSAEQAPAPSDKALVTSQYPHAQSAKLYKHTVHVTNFSSTDMPPNEPPPQTYLQSHTFTLSDGKTVSLPANSLLWSMSFGNRSLVAAVIPDTHPEEDAVGLLSKTGGKWTVLMDTLMERSTSYSQQNLKGLNLPKNTLLEATPMSFYDNKQGNAWVFYTPDGLAAIAKYSSKSFAPPSGAQHFRVRTYDAWMLSGLQGTESLAYMLDGGSMVAVGGNLTPAQSQALLTSLPPLTNPNFPFWHN